MKTAYVSGRLGDDAVVRELIEAMRARGYVITCDWTTLSAQKPYRENVEENRPSAEKMRRAVLDANVFVLVGGERLLGAFIELGMSYASVNTEEVHLIGCERQSIFDSLPEVRIWDDAGSFLRELPLAQ